MDEEKLKEQLKIWLIGGILIDLLKNSQDQKIWFNYVAPGGFKTNPNSPTRPDDNTTGEAVIPRNTLDKGKLKETSKNEVIDYLETIGFTKKQAEEVYLKVSEGQKAS